MSFTGFESVNSINILEHISVVSYKVKYKLSIYPVNSSPMYETKKKVVYTVC